eukprot:g28971.t1
MAAKRKWPAGGHHEASRRIRGKMRDPHQKDGPEPHIVRQPIPALLAMQRRIRRKMPDPLRQAPATETRLRRCRRKMPELWEVEHRELAEHDQPLAPSSAPAAGLFVRAASAMTPSMSGPMPCRQEQQSQLFAHLCSAIRTKGSKKVLYVSGMPGTGKTASVLHSIRALAQQHDLRRKFIFLHVNAMCLGKPQAVYGEIWRQLKHAGLVARSRFVSSCAAPREVESFFLHRKRDDPVLVRPEVRSLLQDLSPVEGLELQSVELLAPGEARVTAKSSWSLLRRMAVLFGDMANQVMDDFLCENEDSLSWHQKMRRDYPKRGDSACAFWKEDRAQLHCLILVRPEAQQDTEPRGFLKMVDDSLDGQTLVPYQCVVLRSAWDPLREDLLSVEQLQRSAYRRANGGSSAPALQEEVTPRFVPMEDPPERWQHELEPRLVVRNTFWAVEERARPKAEALVAISNNIDLPERLLPKVCTRLGFDRVDFRSYTRDEILEILQSRLETHQASEAFRSDTLKFCAARVAGHSGDVRKALQLCRRALDLRRDGQSQEPVTIHYLRRADEDLLQANPCVRAVGGLGVKPRLFLLSLLLEMREHQAEQMHAKKVAQRYVKLHLARSALEQERVLFRLSGPWVGWSLSFVIHSLRNDVVDETGITRRSGPFLSLNSLDMDDLSVALQDAETDPVLVDARRASDDRDDRGTSAFWPRPPLEALGFRPMSWSCMGPLFVVPPPFPAPFVSSVREMSTTLCRQQARALRRVLDRAKQLRDDGAAGGVMGVACPTGGLRPPTRRPEPSEALQVKIAGRSHLASAERAALVLVVGVRSASQPKPGAASTEIRCG